MREGYSWIFFLIVFSIFSGCQFNCGNVGPRNSLHTGGHGPMVLSGPEKWTIDGRPYEISASYYLALPEGLQYTIEYPLPDGEVLKTPLTDESATLIAFPIMKHAFENNFYKRGHVAQFGKGPMTVSRIGVVLYPKHDKGMGFRTAMSFEELENKLKKAP